MQEQSSGSRNVTAQDVLSALARLAALPNRSADVAMDNLDMFVEALDGVRADHLEHAIAAIIKGALNHGFMPSPPELRIQCDRCAKAESEQVAGLAVERRRQEEAAAYRVPDHSADARARVQAMVDAFHRGMSPTSRPSEVAEGSSHDG